MSSTGTKRSATERLVLGAASLIMTTLLLWIIAHLYALAQLTRIINALAS